MVEADPENASSWMILLSERARAGDKAGAISALENIAVWPIRSHSLGFGATAIEAALGQWPEINRDQEFVLVSMEGMVSGFVDIVDSYSELSEACKPETLLAGGSSRQQLCRQIGSNLATTGQSFMGQLIGLGIEENALVTLGEAEYAEDLQTNKLARSQLREAQGKQLVDCVIAESLLPGSGSRSWVRMFEERSRLGEIESWHRHYQRQLDRWAPEYGDQVRGKTP